jgi:hypothetical protein
MTILEGFTDHGAISERRERHSQLPLFSFGPTMWDRQHRAASLMEIARALPRNLSIEYDGKEWRVVVLSAEAQRYLEELEVLEGEVIPDAVMVEQRRRSTFARMQVQQAKDVLRAMQLDHDITGARRALALLEEEGAA